MNLVLLTLVALLVTVSAEEHPHDKPMQFCGATLANVLKIVCEGGDLDLSKLQHVHKHNHDHHHDHEDHEWNHQTIKRDVASGLVEECCLKTCQLKDIASYCTYLD